MMRRPEILTIGASVRADIMRAYSYHGTESGQKLARRIAFEMGELMSDMHWRKEAAAALYEVADKITCHLPLEDFRDAITVVADAAAPAAPALSVPVKPFLELSLAGKTTRICGKLFGLIFDRYWVGFLFGFVLGRHA